jgi:iron(III) transport system ATP-binding protein
MDESPSNSDVELHVEMRSMIKKIQNSIDITTVHVAHD